MQLIQPDIRVYEELDGKTFLISVGGMRCASSWLHRYLASLDGVAVSPLKELHFFNRKFTSNALGDMDLMAIKRLQFHLGLKGHPVKNLINSPAFQASVDRLNMIYDDNAYFGHFARLAEDDTRMLCDITPAYSAMGQDGLIRMRDFCALQNVALKILFVMRDPVARFWSQLRHLERLNPESESASHWEEAISSPRMLARADYEGTVSDLDAVFSEDDILYLFYEDLFFETAQRQLCEFAGIEYAPGDGSKRINHDPDPLAMPDAAHQSIRELLVAQYTFCRSRFGARVPESWAA